jgi:hypothetical protein
MVPVINVDMEAPWEEYDLSGETIDGWLTPFDKAGKAVKRAGYSVMNRLPVELNTLIDSILGQIKPTLAAFEIRNRPKSTEYNVVNHHFIDPLQKLMERVINLQNYYKHRKGIPVTDRWTFNIHPARSSHPSSVDENFYNSRYALWVHHVTQFQILIWNLAKTNDVDQIINLTETLFIQMLNLQNYFLRMNAELPIWVHPVKAPDVHARPDTGPSSDLVPFQIPEPVYDEPEIAPRTLPPGAAPSDNYEDVVIAPSAIVRNPALHTLPTSCRGTGRRTQPPPPPPPRGSRGWSDPNQGQTWGTGDPSRPYGAAAQAHYQIPYGYQVGAAYFPQYYQMGY